MKICIVSHSAGDDGAERVLIETVEVLREVGLECLVVFPEQGPLVPAMAQRGAEYMVVESEPWVRGEVNRNWLRRLNAARSYIGAALKLAFSLARNPCDIVITNTIAFPVGALAATLLRVPHIWWIHEFGEEDHGLRFDLGIRRSTWFIDRSSAIVLVSSAAVASKYSNYIERKKLRLIYYSVHMNFDGARDGQIELWPAQAAKAKHKVCIVGTISENKGQQDAIRAVEKLRRDGIDVALVLVGSTGSYSDQLEDLSRQLGIENQVQFAGHAANPLPIVLSCDVAVVCSRCEAFGRVTVEAMKLGKPVVGTRSGGTVEMIQDGLTGFLYTPGDYEELASKLQILFGDDELRNRMGEAARSWASERFRRARFRDDLVRLLSLAVPGLGLSE